MSKKKIDTSAISSELAGGASLFFKKPQQKGKKGTKAIDAQKAAQTREQKPEQVSKRLSKAMGSSLKTEDIEVLAFELRRIRKVKVNTEVPEKWKDKLAGTDVFTFSHCFKLAESLRID